MTFRRRSNIQHACACALVALLTSATSGQTTWYVDDNNCPGPGTGTLIDPFCSIQAAIDAATSGVGDVIIVQPGTYRQLINTSGKALALRSSDPDDPAIVASTIISADVDNNGAGDGIPLTCTTFGAIDVEVSGFTIRDGFLPFGPGGVSIGGDGHALIRKCTVTMNTVGQGAVSVNGDATIQECLITGNTSLGAGPSGIVLQFSPASIIDCVIMNNSGANSQGGGAAVLGNSPRFTNCRFIGNAAREGAGAKVHFGDPLFVNCVFADNRATMHGGALVVDAGTFVNCTLTRNFANMGAAVSGSVATVTNCVLWGNGPGDEVNSMFGAIAVTHSLVEGGFAGTGNINGDPRFIDEDGLDDISGTPDDDFGLFINSPCVDAGDNTALPADVDDLDGDLNTSESLPLDFAGDPRAVDDPFTADTGTGASPLVDIGVREFTPMQIGVPGARLWANDSGGAFASPANWVPEAPTANDQAVFDRGATYTVTLSGNAALDRLDVPRGQLELDLNGFTLAALESTHNSVQIGQFLPPGLGLVGLTLRDGTLEADRLRIGRGVGAVNYGALNLHDDASIDAATHLLLDGGSMLGGGTVAGLLRNNGVLRASSLTGGLDILDVAGDYEQETGRFPVFLYGDSGVPGVDFEQIAVTGTATLGGTLAATVQPPYVPQNGDTFDVLTAGSLADQFNVVLVSGLPPGVLMTIEYNVARDAGRGEARGPGDTVTLMAVDYTGSLDLDAPADSTLSDSASDVILANLNGDSFLDIAVTLPGLDGVVVLLNDGGSGNTFTQQAMVSVGDEPVSIVAAALNASAGLDLAVANAGDKSVSILNNNGAGAFTVTETVFLPNRPVAIAAGALDPSASIDLAVAVQFDVANTTDGLHVLHNNGSGSFTPDPVVVVLGTPVDIAAADLNGDDIDDLALVLSATNELAVLLNDGLPFARAFAAPVRYAVGLDPRFVNPEDLDGDKDIDFIVGNTAAGVIDGSMTILQNDGAADLNAATLPMQGQPMNMTTGDLDNDGDPELFIVLEDLNTAERVVSVFRNDVAAGQLVFSQVEDLAVATDTAFVRAGDIDNDGQDDIVTISDTTGSRAAGAGGTTSNNPPRARKGGGGNRGPLTNIVSMLKNEVEPNPCPADIMPPGGDGQITIADINFVLSAYGLPCADCPQDIMPQPDGDNQVTIADINAVLTAFGPCEP